MHFTLEINKSITNTRSGSVFIQFFTQDQFGYITEFMGTINGTKVFYYRDFARSIYVDDREDPDKRDTFHIITVEDGVDVDGTDDDCLCLGISENEDCLPIDVRKRIFIRNLED